MLYTGTFEAYQGLDLLFEAAVEVVRDACRTCDFSSRAVDAISSSRRGESWRDSASSEHVILAGERPAAEIPSLLDAADVLVSPRSRGTNTPLKIYQYLRSGRPIVATRLLTHTQVLNDDIAILTGATPAEFAAGILQAIGRSGARGAHWRARGGAGGDEIQLRRVSLAHAGSGGPPGLDGDAGGAAERRVSAEPLTGVKSDHYSYTVYADPAMAEAFDRARFGGPIGELLAESQASGAARVRRRSSWPGSRRSTSEPARRAPRCCLPTPAPTSPLSTRRPRCCGWRERGPRRAARQSVSRWATLITSRTPTESFDLAVSLRVLMHTPDWKQCIAELCRVARHRVILDFPALGSVAALQALGAARCCGSRRASRGVPRVQRSADPRRASSGTASA